MISKELGTVRGISSVERNLAHLTPQHFWQSGPGEQLLDGASEGAQGKEFCEREMPEPSSIS